MGANLQFKDYLFEHNPRRIELTRARMTAAHLQPFRGAVTQDLGDRCRVVRCEGEVCGATAAEAAEKAAALDALRGEQGVLYLPTGERIQAALTRYACIAQGDGRVLSYRLEFTETDSARVVRA